MSSPAKESRKSKTNAISKIHDLVAKKVKNKKPNQFEISLAEQASFTPNTSSILDEIDIYNTQFLKLVNSITEAKANLDEISQANFNKLPNSSEEKSSNNGSSNGSIKHCAEVSEKDTPKISKMADNKVTFYEEIKVIKPFSGNTKELGKFLACCFNAKRNLELPDIAEDDEQEMAEERFIQMISSKLDDDTFRKVSINDPKNMSDFKRCLYEIFNIIRDAAQIYREITTVKQREFEPVADYLDRIESLKQSYEIACEYIEVSQKEKEWMVSQLDKQIRKSCIEGLRSNLRVYCKSRTFNTFKELKNFCIQEERAENEDSDGILENFAKIRIDKHKNYSKHKQRTRSSPEAYEDNYYPRRENSWERRQFVQRNGFRHYLRQSAENDFSNASNAFPRSMNFQDERNYEPRQQSYNNFQGDTGESRGFFKPQYASNYGQFNHNQYEYSGNSEQFQPNNDNFGPDNASNDRAWTETEPGPILKSRLGRQEEEMENQYNTKNQY